MPLYEYQCAKCRHVCEVLQKVGAKPLEKCPRCGGPMAKRVSSPAIQFKGNGWYVTDYAKKSSTPAGRPAETKNRDRDEGKAAVQAAAPKPAGPGSDKSSS